MHRRAHAIAVAEIDVVAHPDLVAVIQDRRAWHGQQEALQQFDLAPVILHQRCQAAADAEIDPGTAVGGVVVPQIVTFPVRHHFERQLVMVAQEHRPLAGLGYVRRLPHDIGDRVPVLGRDRHVDARHQREVERHVAFVTGTEVGQHIFRPLIGLGKQHAPGEILIHFAAQPAQHVVGLRQVLVDRAFALDQIRHRVEAQAIDTQIEPEVHDVGDSAKHPWAIEIEIRLVRIETMPVIGLRLRIPGPVRLLGVQKNDAGIEEFLIGIAPDVIVAPRRARRGAPRALEPGVLVRGVVDHQLGDDAQPAPVRLANKALEIGHAAIGRVDVLVVGDVVAVVAQRRGVEREQPQRRDTEILQIIELAREPL